MQEDSKTMIHANVSRFWRINHIIECRKSGNNMDKNFCLGEFGIILITIAAALLAVSGILFIMQDESSPEAETTEAGAAEAELTGTEITEDFAQCLTDSGAVMYGTDWCHYCQNQKELFGEDFEKINYVNCDYNKAACDDAGVSGYPTWVINGVTYPGFKQIEKLAELSGCEV